MHNLCLWLACESPECEKSLKVNSNLALSSWTAHVGAATTQHKAHMQSRMQSVFVCFEANCLAATSSTSSGHRLLIDVFFLHVGVYTGRSDSVREGGGGESV
jgi:hypothetical protein